MNKKSVLGALARGVALTGGLAVAGGGVASSADAAVEQRSGPGAPAWVVVHTTDGIDDPFESNIAGCEAGTTSDESAVRLVTVAHGVFNGTKLFTCAGATGSFTVHLNASFTLSGSSGTWSVITSQGTLAGARGEGKLTGTIVNGGSGIDDNYRGWISFTG